MFKGQCTKKKVRTDPLLQVEVLVVWVELEHGGNENQVNRSQTQWWFGIGGFHHWNSADKKI
jgi:hypothetical protein